MDSAFSACMLRPPCPTWAPQHGWHPLNCTVSSRIIWLPELSILTKIFLELNLASVSDTQLKILLGPKWEKNSNQFQSRQLPAFVMPSLIKHFCARILKTVSFKDIRFSGQGRVAIGQIGWCSVLSLFSNGTGYSGGECLLITGRTKKRLSKV